MPSDPTSNMVALCGEHDAATSIADSIVFAQALCRSDLDLMVDLSAVRFMSAATVRIILEARETLVARGGSLTVQSASAAARHTFRACHLDELLEVTAVSAA